MHSDDHDDNDGDNHDDDTDWEDPIQPQWTDSHPFLNISLTPFECSVVCSRDLATKLFVPVRNALPPEQRRQCSISGDDYIVIQVYGDSLDAGQRVLELTGPLAMNGMYVSGMKQRSHLLC